MPLDIDTLAQLVDLPIPASCRESVATNVERFAAAAQLVMAFELPPEIESAPVYSNDRT
jgi:hypothetical protein